MATQIITDQNFNDTLSNEKKTLIVVDFCAEWCGPCKMLAPILEEISTSMEENVSIYKLNTDENPQSAQDYQITTIPCCIVFKGKKEIHRIIGHKPVNAFESELNQFL